MPIGEINKISVIFRNTKKIIPRENHKHVYDFLEQRTRAVKEKRLRGSC